MVESQAQRRMVSPGDVEKSGFALLEHIHERMLVG
jgi:hypothetical protein